MIRLPAASSCMILSGRALVSAAGSWNWPARCEPRISALERQNPAGRGGRDLASTPGVDVTLGQAPRAAGTSVRGAALLYRSGALEGRRVAILGDDDSVALAIGLFGRMLAAKELPRRLTVFEIDPERVAFLKEAAGTVGFTLEIVPHDLRDPFAPEFAA